MTGNDWSSPFGARLISAAAMVAEKRLRERQEAMARGRKAGAANGNDGRVADKWQLLRALSQARERFALSDRTICVLEALLSFQPGKEIDGSAPAIVFPSNRELALRTRAMAPATLRRHLAALVGAGLVLRRDSPNGKRFRRRDETGGEGEAFGFDLSPLALAAGAIFEAAEAERRVAAAARRLRSAISIHRRDIRKVVEAALAEDRRGDWAGYLARLSRAVLERCAKASLERLEALEAELVRLRAEVETAYLDALEEKEMSANDARSERHHQNSKPDPSTESNGHRHGEGAEAEPDGVEVGRVPDAARGGGGGDAPRLRRAPETRGAGFDLATVLRLCPDITAYALQPMRDWRDLVTVAQLVRGFLGISQDAWARAVAAMGEAQAATVVACILQRAERITSPGGYLRSLTRKAAAGAFRVEPMLRALE
ncbi:plasmid replication protein RepC [Aurantimonas sp. Leaf443]|uniref:plasmid replication protein RepC n=1 Tax=Aurantimonas sp. Leaf443 TaxID=1736378 RepID=UPI0006FE676F|nr:plasmid replication protein RepC [Aurantimonas sp. Leaf443]KQT87152.1 hypothetical protein ASG48_17495 [Aurantimonas sp. Leaf443]